MRIEKIILILFCSFFYLAVQAQKKAVTESGEEVLLFDDGTWKYTKQPDQTATEIPMNPGIFSKSDKSTFLLKSNKANIGFWLDPKKWSFKKATSNPDAEYELQLKDGDLYGMIISENVEIPLETLKNVVVENGKSAAPDLHIVKEEYRNVNGLKVLFLQMNGTLQGVKFSYYGYYFSNSTGTVQFITYTSQNLLSKYINTCEDLLNGMSELK